MNRYHVGLLSRSARLDSWVRNQSKCLCLEERERTESDIAYVKKCIEENVHRFYIWGKWEAKRKEVLRMDKNECQICKKRGKYTRATTVHHVNYVKKHPELALEIWYTFKGKKKRNLISLCHNCHEEVHGYRQKEKKEPLTQERW